MLSLEEAQQNILEVIKPLQTETIALDQAFGRIVASKIASPINLPSFDNSAMDGYAIQSKDIALASPANPIALRLTETVAAGTSAKTEVTAGNCVRIFTGSMLPKGADSVAMQEDTRREGDQIVFLDSVKPWENIRFHGEDVKAGSLICDVCDKLTVGKLSLLAAVGSKTVNVTQRPVVGLIATGSELVEPGEPLAEGKIYESNRIGLANMARSAGALPKIYPLVEDTLDATAAALETAFAECDCVITSGGVSVGEFDFVKAAFEKLGGTLSFWKVAIRPGKPFVFGRWRDKFLFGLPGNPVSALVTFTLLVRPALLRLQGCKNTTPLTNAGILAEPLSNDGERRHFVRVSVDGSGQVRSSGVQASHILSSLSEADGLVDIPPKTTLPKGELVSVLRWD